MLNQLLPPHGETDPKTVERDFAEMKLLGANVAHVHLRSEKFMTAVIRMSGRWSNSGTARFG